MRMVLALVAQTSLRMVQMDVKSAFQNGKVQKKLYIAQPEGLLVQGEHLKVKILHKALYGLRQQRVCEMRLCVR